MVINGYQLEMPLQSTNATLIDGNVFKMYLYVRVNLSPVKLKSHNKKRMGISKPNVFDKPELIQYIMTDYGQDLKPLSLKMSITILLI